MNEIILQGYGIERAEDRSDFIAKRVWVYFKNGYKLSVIRSSFSYGGRDGLFEIMLSDKSGLKIGQIDSELLKLMDEPVGWLTADEVMVYIKTIGELT